MRSLKTRLGPALPQPKDSRGGFADTKEARSKQGGGVNSSDFEELGSLDDDIPANALCSECITPTTRMTAQVPVDSSPVPSIVEASTKEEDYFFTSLGLDDDEVDQDASLGSGPTAKGDVLLKSRNRDERMRAAYEESKRLYKAEHGYTETGVSSAIAMGPAHHF